MVFLLTQEEIAHLSKYIDANCQVTDLVEEDYYQNPNLIIMDAILSKMRNYDVIKKQSLDFFEKNYSDINTLTELVSKIDEVGFTEFMEYVNCDGLDRIEQIYNLASAFLNYKTTHNFSSDLEAMRHWAKHAEFGDFINQINGIDPTTFQYLQLLLGVDTVKPDVHIMSFLREQTGTNYNEYQSIIAIKELANYRKSSVASLDYAILNHMRNVSKFEEKTSVQEIEKLIDNLETNELAELQAYLELKMN